MFYYGCRIFPLSYTTHTARTVFQDVGRPETESNDRGARVDLSVGGVE